MRQPEGDNTRLTRYYSFPSHDKVAKVTTDDERGTLVDITHRLPKAEAKTLAEERLQTASYAGSTVAYALEMLNSNVQAPEHHITDAATEALDTLGTE